MRIKIIGIVFTIAVLILTIMLGIKSELHSSLPKKFRSLVTLSLKNNTKQTTTSPKTELKIETTLIERFEKLETPRQQLSIMHSLEDSTIVIEAAIPRGKPLEWIIAYIGASIGSAGYRVADCICNESPSCCTIRLKSIKPGKPVVKLVLTQANRFFSDAAKMAIVISDFGFSATTTTVDFLSFPEPLTVELVGSKKMSTWTAQIANEYHKEIVILLPMEPLTAPFRHYAPEALLIHYPVEKVRALLHRATTSVPNYAGFANLCGSRVLDDSQIMGFLLTEIKKEHGYFLVDPVSRKSTAVSTARSLDVPYGVVDMSLDSSGSCSEFLPDTLRHAAMIALKTGTVIVQARATAQFITMLRAQLPYLQHNGIRLVYLSEIVHRPEGITKDDGK